MFRTLTVFAVCGAVTLTGPALAAEGATAQIIGLKGAVSVSQSGKIAQAKTGALKSGNRVIARDGEARLTYADGCQVTLRAGTMATIGETSPCAAGEGLVRSGSAAAQSSFGELTPFGMVMGVLAIGGFIYGVGSLIENQNNDDPVSP